MKNKLLLNFILLIFVTSAAFAQQRTTITGTVTSPEGTPLPGINVVVKGSNVGTATDSNGYYELSVDGDVTLVYSMIGFETVEIETEGRSQIDVTLKQKTIGLEEVTVVGFSEVETEHVASSVATVEVDEVQTQPVGKLQEIFSGTIPGAVMMQGNNLPGEVPGTIHIRGISTLQNAEPLVLVDGIQQSLTDLDPNQIASVTVLKDAASLAMYGSRGANGVILVKTKRGTSDRLRVNVNSWYAVDDPIKLPDFVSSAGYMRLRNEARTMQGQTPLFSQEEITKAENGEMPTTDWIDAIRNQRAFSHNSSLNLSGGGGVATFNLMLGLYRDGGVNTNVGSRKFTTRFNTNINVSDNFVLLADFYARRLGVNRLYSHTNGHGLFHDAWEMNPTQRIYYDSDSLDNYILYDQQNPVASINEGGTYNSLYNRSTINLRPRYHITDNLHVEGSLSYMINKSANKHERGTYKFYGPGGEPVNVWQNSVGASQGVSQSQFTARTLLNYEGNLRQDKDKIYLTAGTEVMNHTYSNYQEVAKASFFGKANYSFDNRYLLELTTRADGSSKFSPSHRWGFFPAGAVAWNVHNEGFMAPLTESGFLNTLKIRLSAGIIGNENIDPYMWVESVNSWGWTMRVPNHEFTWEKQRQTNLGIDLSLLESRLNLTSDVYDKYSYDLIYSNFPVPPLTGSYYLESAVNIGAVRNRGWEVSAEWRDQVGDFSYNIGGMLFNNENEVVKAGYTKSDTLIFKGNPDKIWYRGIAIDNYYGFESRGYFDSQEELNSTTAKLPNTVVGDIRYVDQNGDGVISNEDRVDLGDPFPHYSYAVNLGLSYKRWDFKVAAQGVGERKGRLNGMIAYPVDADGGCNCYGTPREYYASNRWTPETPNSRFPRVWTGSSPNTVLSDVWLSDASFLRIKTLQIGYTVPLSRMGTHIRDLRVYFNAEDPFTSTDWEGIDPESRGGVSYPRMRTFSLGLEVSI